MVVNDFIHTDTPSSAFAHELTSRFPVQRMGVREGNTLQGSLSAYTRAVACYLKFKHFLTMGNKENISTNPAHISAVRHAIFYHS